MLGFVLFFIFFAFLSLLIQFFQTSQKAQDWWVKIDTEMPQCTYYFGPFESAKEAKLTQSGYIEDLEQEGAKGIAVKILQDQPEILTIYEDEGD